MAAPKWFDLYDMNSKLERIGDHSGQYKLRLEVDIGRLEDYDDEKLLAEGWAEELPRQTGSKARAVLVNDRNYTAASEIAKAIGMYFSSEELRSNYVLQDQLRQDERTDGLVERVLANEWEVVEAVSGVDEADRNRILTAVKKAMAARLERDKKEARVPLHQNGLAVFNWLCDFRQQAAQESTVPGYIAGDFAMSLMVEAQDNPDSARAQQLDALALALEDDDLTTTDRIREWMKAEVLDTKGTFTQSHPPDEYPYAAFLLNGSMAGRVPRMSDQEGRDQVLMQAVHSGMLDARSVTPIKAKLTERRTIDTLIRQLPFDVKRDNTIPSRVLADHILAGTRALDKVSEILGMRRDNLLEGQDITPLRFNSGSVNPDSESVVGSTKSVAGTNDEDEVEYSVGLSVSVQNAGAFVHELAHAMDYGNSFSDEERLNILERCGAMTHIMTQIGAAPEDFPDPKHIEYLSRPKEIWARTFVAAMVNRVRADGDRDCLSLGGVIACQLADEMSVMGENDITESFISEVQNVLTQRRENTKKVDIDIEHDAASNDEVENNISDSGPQP